MARALVGKSSPDRLEADMCRKHLGHSEEQNRQKKRSQGCSKLVRERW